jgi:hypothetical protein
MNQFIVYDLDTGITLEIATTMDIEARVGSTKGYIDLVEGFSPRLVGKTRVVDGAIQPYEPELSAEEKWQEVRLRRDRLLAASDWTQVADAPVDREAWRAYRQALRDVPDQPVDYIVWPIRPKG